MTLDKEEFKTMVTRNNVKVLLHNYELNRKHRRTNLVLIWYPMGVLFWLSYGTLKRIRSTFEEDSKVGWRNTMFINMCSIVNEAGLVALLIYVRDTMNTGGLVNFNRIFLISKTR